MNGNGLLISNKLHAVCALVLACAFALPAYGQETPQIEDVPLADDATNEHTPGLYWHPMSLGSESQFNPLTGLMNGGFDILRNPSYRTR
jgi:hypothetical protein